MVRGREVPTEHRLQRDSSIQNLPDEISIQQPDTLPQTKQKHQGAELRRIEGPHMEVRLSEEVQDYRETN